MRRVVIVGAGFFGSVCARELADAGHHVTVLESRGHIGGNCYTRYSEEADCHEHVYGAHIFHTDDAEVWEYVNRFAAFNHYRNHVKVRYRDRLFSFPVNLLTLHQLYGVTTPEEARLRVEVDRVPCEEPSSMEEYCLATFGRRLYEVFIEGYTRKQWGRSPRELPAMIGRRIPIRFRADDGYFSDRFQGIPVGGYTQIFERLLDGVPVELEADFLPDRDAHLRRFDHVVFTGPLDAFFGYCHGALEYRSLRFERVLEDVPDFQGNAVINYTDPDVPHTRVYEHKHLDMRYTTERTLVTWEYPAAWQPGLPAIYPVNTAANQAVYETYRVEASELSEKVTFGGRLGSYRYFDMHQVVGAALATSRRLLERWR